MCVWLCLRGGRGYGEGMRVYELKKEIDVFIRDSLVRVPIWHRQTTYLAVF